MRFKKIKYDGRQVTLHRMDSGQEWDKEETLNSRIRPHPDFVNALAALVPVGLAMIELADLEDVRCQSVSFSEDADGNRGAVVTMLRDVPTGVLVLNTPHTSERPDQEGECSMPRTLSLALDLLEEEAEAYYRREKQEQGDLFAEKSEEEEAALQRDEDRLHEESLAKLDRQLKAARNVAERVLTLSTRET